MCRLIAIGRRDGPLTSRDLEAFQKTMVEWGWSNDDGTGIAWVTENGEMGWVKGGEASGHFFKSHGIEERLGGRKVRTLIGHVRLACSGDSCGSGPGTERGAHPFRSCHDDFVLIHNGWVNSASDVVKEVMGDELPVEKGHPPRYAHHEFQSGVDSEYIVHLIEELGFAKAMERLNDPGNKFNVIVLNRDGSVQAHGDGALLGGGIVAPDGEHPDRESPLWLLASDRVPLPNFVHPDGTPMFPRVVNLTDYDITMNPEGYAINPQGGPGWNRTTSHRFEPRKKHEEVETRASNVTKAFNTVYGKFCPECRRSGMTEEHITNHARRKDREGTPDEVLRGRQTTLVPVHSESEEESRKRRMDARYGRGGLLSGRKRPEAQPLAAKVRPIEKEPTAAIGKINWPEYDHNRIMESFWEVRYQTLQVMSQNPTPQEQRMIQEAKTKRDLYHSRAQRLLTVGVVDSNEARQHYEQSREEGRRLAIQTKASTTEDVRSQFEHRAAELRRKQRARTQPSDPPGLNR